MLRQNMQFSGKKEQINFLGDVLILKSKNIYLCNCLVYHAGKYGFFGRDFTYFVKSLEFKPKNKQKK